MRANRPIVPNVPSVPDGVRGNRRHIVPPSMPDFGALAGDADDWADWCALGPDDLPVNTLSDSD